MEIALILFLTVMIPMGSPQVERVTNPTVEEHIRELIGGLPDDSFLRHELQQGVRGDGVHYPWMDEMRKQGIKRVVVWINIRYARNGRPKQMSVNRTEYFTQYDAGGALVSDTARLNAIRASGLEKELDDLALGRAEHGFWVDVPRPRPNPFVGGFHAEFLDDEWFPIPPVLYCAGSACLQSPTSR